MAEQGTRPDAVTLTMGRYAAADAVPTQGLVVVDGSEGASVRLATCCRPIPGDAIAVSAAARHLLSCSSSWGASTELNVEQRDMPRSAPPKIRLIPPKVAEEITPRAPTKPRAARRPTYRGQALISQHAASKWRRPRSERQTRNLRPSEPLATP